VLAGLEHLDDRYLKAVGYATKSKRGGLPKMVLIGDIAGDDADAVARATSKSCAWPTRAAARASSPSARSAQEVLAGPQAHRRHQQAHQRLQDQRGRGDPAAAHGRVHRRHRAHQHRAVAAQQAGSWPTRWKPSSPAAAAAGQERRRRRDPSAELLEDRVQQALALLREVRASGQWLAGRPWRALFPQLQDHTLRASGRRRSARRCQEIFAGGAFAPILAE
jgi:hypothetical protein